MGGDIQHLPGDDDYLEHSSILRDPRQRRILLLLLDSSQPLTERDLSVRLAAREEGVAPSDVTPDDRESIRVDLYHRCLPKLEANGWIERHPKGIFAADPLPFGDDDPSFPGLGLSDPDPPSEEVIAALLARPPRQDIVSVIASQSQQLTLRELATELDQGSYASWKPETNGYASPALGLLHHVELPKLAEVGLIEYDSDEKTITRTPALVTLANRFDISRK